MMHSEQPWVLILENRDRGIALPSDCTVIEGNMHIGNNVSLQSRVYIPTNTVTGENVFTGPNTVLTNDRYSPSGIGGLKGPKIRNGAAIGANATLLPGVCTGAGMLVAAGAMVAQAIPARKPAIGAPAKITNLPEKRVREETKKIVTK